MTSLNFNFILKYPETILLGSGILFLIAGYFGKYVEVVLPGWVILVMGFFIAILKCVGWWLRWVK
ncbi:MAG: hypothetical protein QXV37_04690 [Candidatus Jordarchaeaceae archaeon]